MTSSHDGCFIVFEGIDGSGTSTQAELLTRRLKERRRVVHPTREPSDGPVGSLLRLTLAGRIEMRATQQAQLMALLFAADRLDHLAQEIRPMLRDGAVVISDRYDLSSIAYQTATAGPEQGAEFAAWVRELNRFALRPDATVVIDVSADLADQRRRERSGAVELYEEPALQARLAELYAEAQTLVPGDRIIHIDGNGGIEAVAEAVWGALEPIINR